MNFIVIIPARYLSTRLPGKPLLDINGKPMIIHVLDNALSSGANRVIVATDHLDIANAITTYQSKGEVCLTSCQHKSGTERLGEVIEHYGFDNKQIIVNIQGDEPLIEPQVIIQVVQNLIKHDSDVSTLAIPITSITDAYDVNLVKVVINVKNYALYFSRSIIPYVFFKDDQNNIYDKYNNTLLLKHVGIYAYRVSFLRRYFTWPVSDLEKIESLEQLRVLWYGGNVYVAIAKHISNISVNTMEDLKKVTILLKNKHSI